MTTIDGKYTVVSQHTARPKPGIGKGTLSVLVFALVGFLAVVGAMAVSENPWAIWNEFMLVFGYVTFSVSVLVIVVWVRGALQRGEGNVGDAH